MQESHTKATWIWYPGDFEIWLGNIFNNRRTERGAMFPPFWKQDSHFPTLEFSTRVTLDSDETIGVWTEGKFNFMLDGKLCSVDSAPQTIWYETSQLYEGYRIIVPKGEHTLSFKVWNQRTPPALFVDSPTIKSGNHWLTTYEDKIWIDENGIAHGSGIYVPAGSWNFNQPGCPPSAFRLKTKDCLPVGCKHIGTVKLPFFKKEFGTCQGELYDFGREVFGHLEFRGCSGDGRLYIYYGESKEEALDTEHCETLDSLGVINGRLLEHLETKAMRYVYIIKRGTADFEQLALRFEYAPYDEAHSGSFRCSDEELNRIWDISAYTMDLTTREFFVDGIKRDRWTWSGDAIQSYLMNYYLRFDTECVKRTIRQLRGKDPVTAHINTIMDYTFYWFKSVLDYYEYTADGDFVREMWPRMQTLMQYVLGRTNAEGWAEGQPDDWIFVDWVDFPMHKRGTLCFEQILFISALFAMEEAARICGDEAQRDYYQGLAAKLIGQVNKTFWSDEQHAFLHAIEEGKLNEQVTKFPNMFYLLNIAHSKEMEADIMQHVMLNPAIPPITTPYMRFYELETLCRAGLQEQVLKEIKAYWGGMLREGATSFWEKYVPTEHGTEHLAMYGRPYGKSLCHAWGASPIYLLGRYYLGVQPLKPGYAEWVAQPQLAGLEWMEGTVPTPNGLIRLHVDANEVRIYADEGKGQLNIDGRTYAITNGREVVIKRHHDQ